MKQAMNSDAMSWLAAVETGNLAPPVSAAPTTSNATEEVRACAKRRRYVRQRRVAALHGESATVDEIAQAEGMHARTIEQDLRAVGCTPAAMRRR
ncbi:MAG: hypothetical protein ACK54X_22670 [Burkholderiales bacterium]|jgi:hypothetical protein